MLNATGHDTAAMPNEGRVFQALRAVARQLGQRYAYAHRGSYHFSVDLDEWTIAVTPESAGRFRVEACSYGVPRSTLWCLSADLDRLAALVAELDREVRALSATT